MPITKTFLLILLFVGVMLGACSLDPPEARDSRGDLPIASGSATSSKGGTSSSERDTTSGPSTPQTTLGKSGNDLGPPVNLGSPFDPADLVNERGFISPFGVVRKLLDRPEYGHSGVDIPLVEGSPILAVADGAVLAIKPAEDKFPGQIILLLIKDGDRDGEGWVFLVEHVEVDSAISAGGSVVKGQQIGTSTIPSGRGNTHMQLSYYFNSFEYSREHTCWLDYMEATARTEIDAAVSVLFSNAEFLGTWRTATDDGQYPLRGLLDESEFPGGPRLCYPQGTDVRAPVE